MRRLDTVGGEERGREEIRGRKPGPKEEMGEGPYPVEQRNHSPEQRVPTTDVRTIRIR